MLLHSCGGIETATQARRTVVRRSLTYSVRIGEKLCNHQTTRSVPHYFLLCVIFHRNNLRLLLVCLVADSESDGHGRRGVRRKRGPRSRRRCDELDPRHERASQGAGRGGQPYDRNCESHGFHCLPERGAVPTTRISSQRVSVSFIPEKHQTKTENIKISRPLALCHFKDLFLREFFNLAESGKTVVLLGTSRLTIFARRESCSSNRLPWVIPSSHGEARSSSAHHRRLLLTARANKTLRSPHSPVLLKLTDVILHSTAPFTRPIDPE